ncbi:MAG: 5'/3'-nucleotidase SurE [Acidimicrobiia bacterium]
MRILVTNDDGVGSPGIKALATALVRDGHEVFVVAPTDDRSGSGAAVGKLYNVGPQPVVTTEWDDLPGVPVHAIDAPPGTAALVTCLGAFGPLPDLVASGINPGANTGHLTLHSGTVGATLTAASYGIPGIAVSLEWEESGEYRWDTAATFAAAAVEWVTTPDDLTRVLNVNVPNLPVGEVRGVREAELAAHGEVWVASAEHTGADVRLEVTGRGEAGPDTDAALVLAGYVAVTPLAEHRARPRTGAAGAVAARLSARSGG